MMARTDRQEVTGKITVQLWVPLLQKLNEMTKAACLNRDAFLDIVLAHEARGLVSELNGRRNSGAACSYIKRCLHELDVIKNDKMARGLRKVSLALSPATSEVVTKACSQVNVARDSFLNRVIYLLVAKSSELERKWHFKFDDYQAAILDEGWVLQACLLGPRLPAIRGLVNEDPFFGLRTALRHALPETNGAVHAQLLGRPLDDTPAKRGLVGFNVYLPDELVPGTSTQKEMTRVLDELASTLTDGARVTKRGRT